MTMRADHEGREAASVPRVQRYLLIAAVLVLFVVAMLAASLAGHPTFTPPVAERAPGPAPTPVEITPGPESTMPPPQDGIRGFVVLMLLLLLVLLVVLVVLFFIVRALIGYWKNRPLRQREGVDTDEGVSMEIFTDSAPDAPTMRRGIAAARTLIDTQADPGDAIVAAWVGLEETAADSGTARGRSETPAEFTLRILLRRPGLDEPAHRLLRLYEGVRFGGHSADEADRSAAVRALVEIEEGWR
ncbi:transmembrane protein [Microbacterium esteraromaticum]|uniref:Transmembrane protein n=1 Tax=Microbacterium esteraromaticum TaxID=57043 RepID=A0A1R4IH48_9MICO|nr:DUF4129 domain-containing protein [Microbacterium esteraromaticum]SJN19111.1 transmembrane protein [Microbacterium esteraromaticum]